MAIEEKENSILNLLIGNMVEEMKALRVEVQALKAEAQTQKTIQTSPRGNGRGKMGGKAVLDTKTGKVYPSHASAGMAVAPELGLPVHNYVWFEVIRTDAARFKDISTQEYWDRVKTAKEAPATPAVQAKPEVDEHKSKATLLSKSK